VDKVAYALGLVLPPAEDTLPAAFAEEYNIDEAAAFVAFPQTWNSEEIADASNGLWDTEVASWYFD
jgi:hypothetical protein